MMRITLRLGASIALLALAACAAVPDKPVRSTLYDLGPGPLVSSTAGATLPPIVLADIEASGSLENSALLYRLNYADEHQLRPYSQSRWVAPPPQLIRQRLREQIGRDRPVLDLSESAALARTGGVMPRVLRIDLEEFSHHFESPVQSTGVLRLRATLLENTPAGERLIAQRSIVARKAAPTADAPGGVRSLAAAADAAAEEIRQWLAQQR